MEVCPTCKDEFGVPATLRIHMRTKHENVESDVESGAATFIEKAKRVVKKAVKKVTKKK